MKSTLCAVLLTLSTGLFSQMTSAASIKELLEEAIDSPTGNVMAPLDGEMTDLIRRTAPVRGDVMAEIKTIKRFNEEGCRRFSVNLKAAFSKESGQSGPVPLPAMEMNYCKGGGFPKEGYDSEAGERFMNQVDEMAKERGIKVPARPLHKNYAPSWAAATEAKAAETSGEMKMRDAAAAEAQAVEANWQMKARDQKKAATINAKPVKVSKTKPLPANNSNIRRSQKR